MKGTLFSADFVKDSDGDAKLLEINTDTAIIGELNSNIDFTDFYQVLSDNSITDLQVIYKNMQKSIIDRLKEQNPGGITITETIETRSSIFPTAIADAADRFILRLAYDENALLDVLYAKNDSYLHGLFEANNSSSLIVPGMHAGAQSGYNNLQYELNDWTKPDFVVKPAAPVKAGLGFYKLAGTGSFSEQMRVFTSSIDLTENIITNYVHDGTNVAKSIRSFQVVYGTDLDLCWIGEYQIEALFPHTETINTDSDVVVNKLPNKHYFEFATNDVTDYGGVHVSESINREDGGSDIAVNAAVGTIYDSYFISGSPEEEDESTLDDYFIPGNELPSGSYSTSSSLEIKAIETSNTNTLRELQFDDETTLVLGGVQRVLVFDPELNSISYKMAKYVEPNMKVYDNAGNEKVVSAHNVLILNDDVEAKTVELGVEEVDNFIVSGSDIILHNAPCFAAGTMINCWDGTSRPIEDLVADKSAHGVISWDFANEAYAHGPILQVTTTEDQEVWDYEFEWSNGTKIPVRGTADHPFYVVGKGWSTIDPDALQKKTGMETDPFVVGDEVFTGAPDGSTSKLISVEKVDELHTVYNLDNIQDYNNFFVYGMLVHNRWIFSCHTFDSQVEMADGTTKAIGEVKVGDKVISIKDGIVTEGTVTDHLTHVTNDVMRVIKTSNGYTEINHPILVDGEWVAAKELGEVESVFVDNFYNLEIDGNISTSNHNFIVDGMVSSGLGDNKELNAKYQRQPKQLTKHL